MYCISKYIDQLVTDMRDEIYNFTNLQPEVGPLFLIRSENPEKNLINDKC